MTTPPPNPAHRLEHARAFMALEAEAIRRTADHLDDAFLGAVELLLAARGRVVATGMGKAGLIARKAASTFASTGTPAVFLHPAEAIHGDLGMVTAQDVVVAFSHQGQTEEVLRILPFLKFIGVPLVAVTSNVESELARSADVVLRVEIEREACPLNLAPTSSTTAMLALADTLALVLLQARGFGPDDYARLHPGGSLGRRLLTRAADLMHAGEANPVVSEATPLREAIVEMTRKKLASVSVVDDDGRLTGFFSTGDLGRVMSRGVPDMATPMRELMTRNPKVTHPETMAVRALEVLREFKIIALPVVDADGRPVGMLHLHDISRAGIT